eukprot:12410822-Karenia_brevis.AAC.1
MDDCGGDEYTFVNTSKGLYKFCAQAPQLTEPFHGERFTITCYTDGRMLEGGRVLERLHEIATVGAPAPSTSALKRFRKNTIRYTEENKMLGAAECCALYFLKAFPLGNRPMAVCWDCSRRGAVQQSQVLCKECDIKSACKWRDA